MQRALERRVSILTVGSAVFFTTSILVWRFSYGSDPFDVSWELPPLRMHGFDAFEFILWLVPVVQLAILALLAGIVLRWVTRWRRATSWIPIVLPMLVCLLTAAIFVPFWGSVARRVDRVARTVEEPIPAMQTLAVTVAVTFTLAAAFIAVTRQRRTPTIVRYAALMPTAVLCGLFLNLYWLFLAFPMTNDWSPADWSRLDLVAPFRPCRNATQWRTSQV